MRKIGDTLINAIGYGAMGISVAYGPPLPTEQRLKVYRDFMRSWAICSYVELQVLDAVYERGCNHWDTSDVYADSEDLIGEWSVLVCYRTTVSNSSNERRFRTRGKRNDIFLATKFGFRASGARRVNCSPEYVNEAVDKSLKRLGVDYIDLYYAHRCALSRCATTRRLISSLQN